MSLLVLALIAVLVVLVVVLAWPTSQPRARFYTSAVVDEPTRPYTPYTGTPDLGPWGVAPWAEAALSPAPLCG